MQRIDLGRTRVPVIEIEIQNETHQSQFRIRAMAVPRIGEGIRLQEPGSVWASYDVLDVWYQQAEFGQIWVPYIHVRMTPSENDTIFASPRARTRGPDQAMPIEEFLAKFEGSREHEPVKLTLDMSEN